MVEIPDKRQYKVMNSKMRSVAIQRVGTILGAVIGVVGLAYIILDHIGNHYGGGLFNGS